jgi:hypothetical protein
MLSPTIGRGALLRVGGHHDQTVGIEGGVHHLLLVPVRYRGAEVAEGLDVQRAPENVVVELHRLPGVAAEGEVRVQHCSAHDPSSFALVMPWLVDAGQVPFDGSTVRPSSPRRQFIPTAAHPGVARLIAAIVGTGLLVRKSSTAR